MALITKVVDMMIAPKIHPVWSGLGILLYLESSSPGVGASVGVGAGLCRFCRKRACWPRPIPDYPRYNSDSIRTYSCARTWAGPVIPPYTATMFGARRKQC